MTEARPVVIVGGGLAGLAAATQLAAEGQSVLLLEARSFLGGRVFSYTHKETGEIIDNCQHGYTPAYQELYRYLCRIGAKRYFTFPETEAIMRDPLHGLISLARGPRKNGVIGPLNMVLGFLLQKNIPFPDKLRYVAVAIRLAVDVKRGSKRIYHKTADEWLNGAGMPLSVRRAFLDLVITSIWNEETTRVSAGCLVDFININAAYAKAGSDPSLPQLPEVGFTVGYPRTDFGTAFIEPGVRFIREHGGEVRTNYMVTGLRLDASGAIAGLATTDGPEIQGCAYVLTIPPTRLAKLLHDSPLRQDVFFAGVENIKASPIIAAHLWFDGPLKMKAKGEFIVDSTTHFIFDRNAIAPERQGPGYYYTTVTSAANELAKLPLDQCIERILYDVKRHYPEARQYKLLHKALNKEPIATSSLCPGTEKLRCSQKTPVANLFLAGDWTDTGGLPCTMESASKSGHLAARSVQQFLA